jgi:TRAP-type C4-dicarboxylate transport system permease large subunit
MSLVLVLAFGVLVVVVVPVAHALVIASGIALLWDGQLPLMLVAQQIGLDPLQLGPMMILNPGIGLCTPPVGTTLFISSPIAGSSMSETVKAPWRFFWVAITLLAAIRHIPALTIRFWIQAAGGAAEAASPSWTVRGWRPVGFAV